MGAVGILRSLFISGAKPVVLAHVHQRRAMEAAWPPPGTLPDRWNFFQETVLLTDGSKCQAAALSLPWASSFLCSKPNRHWEGTYTHDHLFGPFLSKLSTSVSISSLLTAVIGAYKHLTAVSFANFHLSCPACAHTHLSPGLHGQRHPCPWHPWHTALARISCPQPASMGNLTISHHVDLHELDQTLITFQ